jgi:hypothetical protein
MNETKLNFLKKENKHLNNNKNNKQGSSYKAINYNKLKEFSKSEIQQHYKSSKYKKYKLKNIKYNIYVYIKNIIYIKYIEVCGCG